MRIGLIVGTGMDSLAAAQEWSEVATPYGPAFLATAVLSGREVVLLRRHGPMLNVPPHLINYRANIWALRNSGVQRVIATAAVGSLRRDLAPGDLAVIGDFIDFTKRRESTFFDQPGAAVVHVDFTTPYCPEISNAIEEAARPLAGMGQRVTYLCVDGPRYETPAEIRMFAGWGADVVGMTGVPEVVLARELGICYGAMAVITNFACGIQDRPLSHEEVLVAVSEKRETIRSVIEGALDLIPDERGCCCGGCVNAPSPASGRGLG